MDEPEGANPANDFLASVTNLIGLSFGLACIWIVISVARL